jgi:peptide/nickel transport system substrate-binding protein/oligopeptide transport system substrate-binding protein
VTIKVITDPAGRLLAYQNDEVDVTPSDVTTYQGDQELNDQTDLLAGYSVDYLNTMFSTNAASADPDVHQALSMAIDREALAKVRLGTQPGVSLVPDSVPQWNDSLATTFDPEEAADVLASAGYPDGEGMPTVKILSGSANPVISAVAEMWEENLNITVEQEVVDTGVFVETRWATLPDPNMIGFYYGAFGGIPTLNNWVYNIWGPVFTEQFSLPATQAQQYIALGKDTTIAPADKAAQQTAILEDYASSGAQEFAATTTEAVATVDADERVDIFLDAAQQREELALTVPLLWLPKSYLVKPDVEGLNLRYTPESFYFKGITAD